MILADTSVWIDYFNGAENEYVNILDTQLDSGTVVMGDLIFLEILQGFRSDTDYKRAKSAMQVLGQYEMLSKSLAVKSADNYRALRKLGITIRRTTDVIIATFCIENRLPLLFSDEDFAPFVDHFGLKSASKPARV